MKTIAKSFKSIFIILFILVGLLYIFNYEYILRGVRIVYMTGHVTAYIDDTPHFDTRVIKNDSNKIIPWQTHFKYNKIPVTKKLDSTHKALGTVAYLIIKNDSIFHESYAKGYSQKSQTNSFSMAKSITTALLFKAIDDGYIKNLEAKVNTFLPEIEGTYAAKLTVGDLSSMASGLNWDESYSSPFSVTARANYDADIRKLMLNLKVIEEPGQSFKYLSGATQILGLVIEKATRKKLTNYLSESFWKPLNMSQLALWQLDSENSGLEKVFCCIASNARDFARFGQLWNNNGQWQGKQLISKELVEKAQQPRFKESPEYGYGLWLEDYKGKKITYMRGILGQYVICIPQDNLIIVRLGHHRSPTKPSRAGADFYIYIEEAYKMLSRR